MMQSLAARTAISDGAGLFYRGGPMLKGCGVTWALVGWPRQTPNEGMHVPATITLVRAARELLGWNQHDLAERANVSIATLRRYETGATIQPEKVQAILAALQGAGIAFLGAHNRGIAITQGVALVPAPVDAAVDGNAASAASLDGGAPAENSRRKSASKTTPKKR